jgi:hypothetical protein
MSKGIENMMAGENNENTSDLNNREKAMIERLNEETGSDHPLTEEGYKAAGKTWGILNKLATTEEEREELRNDFRSISRGL